MVQLATTQCTLLSMCMCATQQSTLLRPWNHAVTTTHTLAAEGARLVPPILLTPSCYHAPLQTAASCFAGSAADMLPLLLLLPPAAAAACLRLRASTMVTAISMMPVLQGGGDDRGMGNQYIGAFVVTGLQWPLASPGRG